MSEPVGVKPLDETLEELMLMSLDMPILYNFFQYWRFAGFSREHLLAGLALNLAVALKETQKQLLDAINRSPAPLVVWKENFS